MLQSDELPLGDLLNFAGIFLVAAFFMALGAVCRLRVSANQLAKSPPRFSKFPLCRIT